MAQPSAAAVPSVFLFTTCQLGAEQALKAEMARRWPAFRLAFSRPGFLTFKLPLGHGLPADFDPQLVFARSSGFSLGKVTSADLAERVRAVWDLAGDLPCEALHVWARDTAPVGFRGFEPHVTDAERAADAAIRERRAAGSPAEAPLRRIAAPGQWVLDCVLVEPEQWWIGYHRAVGESRFPGGLRELELPAEAISRAYLKMAEALAWSALPAKAGQTFVEIGCSPGGASWALLTRGMKVIGVDPARVDPRVLAHANFVHINKRGADVRRREFRNATWLAADMNVAPQYTLDTVEAIVTHSAVNVRGLLLTLKLPEWELAEQIPAYLERIGGWGFARVQARQLVHNRQEICVAAQRATPARSKPARARAQRNTPE